MSSLRSFHTRENRGFDMVRSTQKYVSVFASFHYFAELSTSRLFWYAVLESLGVIGMAV